MATVIMGIPPEETKAFKTDVDYRLSVADAMNDALDQGDVDEVILTYSADDESEIGDGDIDFAMNPGVADFLKSKGVGDDVIDYILTFQDTKVQGKLANEIRKALQSEDRLLGLQEIRKIGEPLRPKELSPLELALYEVVRDEKNMTNWLGREIRLMKKEYGPEMDRADIIQFLFPLQSIKDWYIANNRPSLVNLSFKDAHDKAVEWEEAMAAGGEGKFYGPVKPENILYLDPKTGYTVQLVTTLNDLTAEGAPNRMNHCVSRYWDVNMSGHGTVQDGNVKILSLRDPSNVPHITLELVNVNSRNKDAEPDWRVNQIKGRSNSIPKPEYREILARYLMTIPDLQYAYQNQRHIGTKGFRSLAIESAVGFHRWDYEADSSAHGRPDDLTDEETAAIIVDHTKNITAILQHAKRYNWKMKKGDEGLRFQERTVGLDIKDKRPDSYGIMMVTEKREETKLNASTFSGDLRVFLGDVWLDKDQDRPLTPVLKEVIDIFVGVIVEVNKVENKLHDQWKKAVEKYLADRKATLEELEGIGPDNLAAEHFRRGLLKKFYAEQKRSEYTPYPSYANQKFLLEKDISRAKSALSDRRYRQPISVKIASVAPFSYDSFSKCAQKVIIDPSSKDGNPPGRWNTDSAIQYFAITTFEKINGCSLFAE